ncbi:hypothetical protein C6P45_003257 [Maudiozyma exigua]|uniref:Uncharacterized protein n=1 Tax=Maudiozyma exigua TaxID=34358 RepID=A0A9P6WES8_MAUEX|nr:hypothetical protein C6P45_003257 [Kazachstania exigua]
MTEVSAATETRSDLDANNLLDQLFLHNEEHNDKNDTTKYSNDDEDDSLYKLLDEISGARKLMSCIFGPAPEINLSARDNQITTKTLQIGEEWYNQEHTVSNDTTSARALRSDTPVYFSWSHDNKQGSRPSSPVKKPVSASDSTLSVNETNSGTVINNQRLMAVVANEMKTFKGSPYSWDNILEVGSTEPLEIKEKIKNSNPIQSTDRTIKGDTNFKVNPFAKFVAHELPKPKKQEKKSDSKAHHSKSKLWFWSSKKSKKKSKEKKKSDEIKEENYKKVQEVENSTQQDLQNTDIDDMEAKSINSKVSRTTSNILNELLDEDPVGKTDSNTAIDYLQTSDNGNSLELQLTNTNTVGLDKSFSSISGHENIDGEPEARTENQDQIKNSNRLNSTMSLEQREGPIIESNSESDSDDDFGNFEQATPSVINDSSILDLPSPPAMAHPIPQIQANQEQITHVVLQDRDEKETNVETSTAHLTMNSFVPLQPSKK